MQQLQQAFQQGRQVGEMPLHLLTRRDRQNAGLTPCFRPHSGECSYESGMIWELVNFCFCHWKGIYRYSQSRSKKVIWVRLRPPNFRSPAQWPSSTRLPTKAMAV